MNEKTKRIMTIIELNKIGLCNSCDYGIEQCIKDGKPFCKKEDDNEQEESV